MPQEMPRCARHKLVKGRHRSALRRGRRGRRAGSEAGMRSQSLSRSDLRALRWHHEAATPRLCHKRCLAALGINWSKDVIDQLFVEGEGEEEREVKRA